MSASSAGDAEPSGLAPARALSDLLPCGVVLIDRDARVLLANARACALLGASDEAALRARWTALRESQGPRLRIETHPIGDAAHQLVLLEDPRSMQTLGVLTDAGRAHAEQYVLAGVLHDLNGRLNNLNLTLTLLDTTLARHAPDAPAEALVKRCRGYAATLASEAKRLGDALRPLTAMVAPEPPSGTGVEIARLFEETRAVLRHATVLHEVALAAAVPDTALRARDDAALLRLALLDIVTGLMALTPPGGEITLSARADGDCVVIRCAARGARIPDVTLRAFDRIAVTTPSDAPELHAARAIIGAQGGSVALQASPDGALIEAHLARQRDDAG